MQFERSELNVVIRKRLLHMNMHMKSVFVYDSIRNDGAKKRSIRTLLLGRITGTRAPY